MLSLRDRIRSAMPPVKKAEKTEAEAERTCWERCCVFPAKECGLPDIIPSHALRLVFGEECSPLPLSEVLFLDTETTGLSGGAGTLAFECGAGFFSQNGFEIRQYVIRDYCEEEAMLKKLAALLEGKQAVCTFNGKTFDIPLLESRFVMNRMRFPHGIISLDLLHAARRVWKLRLGRCNLSMLEEKVLGKGRGEDLPGSQVPERFFTYLKTRDFSCFEDVLSHNLQDVKSLADVLHALILSHEAPESLTEDEDIYSVGRVLEKRGETARARRCFRLADRGSLSALSRTQLAESFRKDKQYDKAAEVWRIMIKSRQGGLFPYIALAKLLEHRMKDTEGAMRVTAQAMFLAAERNDPLHAELEKRYLRLDDKLRRQKNGT